jgi:hypothetical protein
MKKLEAILEIIKFAIELYRGFKKAKNEKKEQQYLEAIRSGDVDYINQYLRPGSL